MPARIPSPTGGRDIANPQNVWLDYCDDGERIRMRFDDPDLGGRATVRMTPQAARHYAYLLMMAAASVDDRLVAADDEGFLLADRRVDEARS